MTYPMRMDGASRVLFSFFVRTLCFALNPIFLLPFIAGATYSYLYPETVSLQNVASAETTSDQDLESDSTDESDSPKSGAKKKKTPLPDSGMLSQTRNVGTSGSSVPAPWGQDVLSDEAPPIGGSVSRIGSRQWVMKVLNSTEDTYNISIELMQMARSGKKLKSDYYSYTLKGGDKVERKFTTNQDVVDCGLKLTKWKNMSKGKKAAGEKKAVGEPTAGAKLVVEPIDPTPSKPQ